MPKFIERGPSFDTCLPFCLSFGESNIRRAMNKQLWIFMPLQESPGRTECAQTENSAN